VFATFRDLEGPEIGRQALPPGIGLIGGDFLIVHYRALAGLPYLDNAPKLD
jgi:hypothetical protein